MDLTTKVIDDLKFFISNAHTIKAMSEYQAKICRHFAQNAANLVVRALAGTGKTTTIMEAVFWIPRGREVMMVAFNKKIAVELQKRIKEFKAAGLLQDGVEAATSHSLGAKFLAAGWGKIDWGTKKDPTGKQALYNRGLWIARTVLGSKATDILVRKIRDLASLGKGICPWGTPEDLIEIAYNFNITPDALSDYTVADYADWAYEAMQLAKEKITTVWARNKDAQGGWVTVCKKPYVIDFDDMVYLPLVLGYVKPTYDDIIIDEAQDMNKAQIELILRACRNNPALANL